MLLLLSMVVILGWASKTEPDCYYTTDVLLQLRLCSDESVRLWGRVEWTLAIASLVLLGAGLLLTFGIKDNNERMD